VLPLFWGFLIAEELVQDNPLLRIKCPKAEKKVIKGLPPDQVSRLLGEFDTSFSGRRNRGLLLVLIDSGLRLGEALSLTVDSVDMNHQILTVQGRTGERVVRFGTQTAKALLKYLMARGKINSACDSFWLTSQGQPLTHSGVESLFKKLSAKTGIAVHPHPLRHTFAAMWLRNGGDSLMLQRLLGHSTLTMTNKYAQAVGCLDAVESHKRYGPADNLRFK
jgi:site-specific recombinase XerD